MKTKLTMASLHEVDGGLVGALGDRLIKELVRDCEQRPGESRPRVLNAKVQLIPRTNEFGNCDEVEVDVQLEAKEPSRRSRSTSMAIAETGGGLIFNGAAPENPRQGTLDEIGGPEDSTPRKDGDG